jgi:hypothetical protein
MPCSNAKLAEGPVPLGQFIKPMILIGFSKSVALLYCDMGIISLGSPK